MVEHKTPHHADHPYYYSRSSCFSGSELGLWKLLLLTVKVVSGVSVSDHRQLRL